MRSVWFVIESAQDIQLLIDMWNGDASTASALVMGDEEVARTASGLFAKTVWVNTEGNLAEGYAEAAAGVLADLENAAVLGVAHPATRIVAGRVAVAAGIPIVSNVTGAAFEGDALEVSRSVYDDYVERDAITGAAFVLMNPVAVKGDGPEAGEFEGAVEKVTAENASYIDVIEMSEVPASAVESADYVVGVGFGARSPEAFAAARELADAMGAKIGATMSIV